jgi:hypothetical protein
VKDAVSGMYDLNAAGHWNVANLEEAFEDLSSDELLNKAPAPRQPKTPPPVTVSQEPAPAPRPDERIVQVVTRPRAATGLRPSDVTPVAPPPAPTAPSVEDLENLTDAQVKELMAGVRRQRILSRRS